jgi:hypothetical protein
VTQPERLADIAVRQGDEEGLPEGRDEGQQKGAREPADIVDDECTEGLHDPFVSR